MSELLTDPALPVTDETAPVGDTSAVDTAVGSGSALGEDTVPVSRFNGLMATMNKAKEEASQELARRDAELESLRRELDNRSTPDLEDESEVSDDRLERLEQLVTQLSGVVLGKHAEDTKAAVLSDFPEAAPFADLITTDDPAEYRQVAEELSKRVKSLTASAETSPPSTDTPAAPTADMPVVGSPGGSTGDPGSNTLDDAVSEAVRNKDMAGWLDALAARSEALSS